MVDAETTPIGFLPGVIWANSHILYTYTHRDEKFIKSVVDYLMGGVDHGELPVCLIEQPFLDDIAVRLADRCSSIRKKDRPLFVLQSPEESFLANGVLDVVALREFWNSRILSCCPDSHGIRLFSDVGRLASNRIARLKLIEFESRMNYALPANLTLCAYDFNVAGRSMLAQARSVHPFIANCRSIRINPEYMQPSQFLSAFYRRASVCREYTAHPSEIESVAQHLAEAAARTPLTIPEVFGLCTAVTWVVNHLIERNHSGGSNKKRIQVTFASESDAFRVTIKDSSDLAAISEPMDDGHVSRSTLLANGLVDDLSLQTWNNTISIALTKRYHSYREWLA